MKGTVQRDFRPPVFFSLFEPACVTVQRVKIFSIFVKNSLIYSNFKSENLTPRGIIPQRVSLPGVLYPGESVSRNIIPQRVNLPGYHTPASQSPRGIIPRRVNKKSTKT